MKYYFRVLRNYASFSGRARRSEYWYFFLFNCIVAFSLAFIGAIVENTIPYAIYTLAVLIPGIAVAVRRMHDVGRSGWYCLIPIYNLILACSAGIVGDNEYGPDPKELI